MNKQNDLFAYWLMYDLFLIGQLCYHMYENKPSFRNGVDNNAILMAYTITISSRRREHVTELECMHLIKGYLTMRTTINLVVHTLPN